MTAINSGKAFEKRFESFITHLEDINQSYNKELQWVHINDIRDITKIIVRPAIGGGMTLALEFDDEFILADEIPLQCQAIFDLYFQD